MAYLQQNPAHLEVFERVCAVLDATKKLGPEHFDLRIRLVAQETAEVKIEQAARDARPTARPPRPLQRVRG